MNSHRPYRRPLRMQAFDYGSTGGYYITICTWQKEFLLGDVVDEQMQLNDAGRIVLAAWESLPERFPHVRCDAFVIMPNHAHGILWITNAPVGARLASPAPSPETTGEASLAPTKSNRPTLGQVIGAFKSITTVQVNRLADTQGRPLWQRNYYERIVRNEVELRRIRQYIADNPAKWDQDPENPRTHQTGPPCL